MSEDEKNEIDLTLALEFRRQDRITKQIYGQKVIKHSLVLMEEKDLLFELIYSCRFGCRT